MIKLLFTSIGRRVELLRCFADNEDIYLIGTDASNLAPAAYICDDFCRVPPFGSASYIDALFDICNKNEVSMLIPLHEGEFPVLMQNRKRFEDINCVLLLSSDEVINVCQDKYDTFLFFEKNSIMTPDTFLPDEINLNDVNYPMFIKPRDGMGSRFAFKVSDEREMEFLINYVPHPIIQSFIEGTEYTADVLCDMSGNVISVVPRRRIEVKDGEISKGCTVRNFDMINAVADVAKKLGGVGPLTIQYIINECGNMHFIEINPRLGGGVPLSIKAGIDYPKILMDMVQGKNVSPMLGDFKDDFYFMRYIDSIYRSGDELL